jgi:hypothetical protein
MSTPGKKNPIRWLIELLIVVTVAAYAAPTIKHALFPDQMTRLEKMLRQSTMAGYNLAVDRKHEREIILTVYNGAQSITTEIYKGVVSELEPEGDSRIFFTHAINRNADGVFYLSRTRIEADPDLKKVRLLEMTVCDRIKDQTGRVPYDGHEPIYECEMPIQKVVCLSME